MAKRILWATLALLVCACVQGAMAMGHVSIVTKKTQAEMGLKFALVADQVDEEAILVHMEIPRQGKLKDLRTVELRIGDGRPKVAATLLPTVGKNGVWEVSFQVAPELSGKCYIDLIMPRQALSYVVYAVELKGYVTRRK